MYKSTKSFIRVKLTQNEKVRFISGNELKSTQDELFSFFYFKRELLFLLNLTDYFGF